ncbi:hypothetical protein KJ693_07255 [bacterium]|nr:hypothetical protein [bacterium]MBU1615098.1 hypothetical protein [bacterium]
MKGEVAETNPRKGFIAVATDRGFSILEILEVSADITPGDEIMGDLHDLGRQDVFNARTGDKLDVFIQDCYCSHQAMKRHLYD